MGKNSKFNIGDKVFAKVKGYPPWPANIVADNGKKKYNVVFYGTKETGNIKVEDICYFNQYKDGFLQKYQKRAGYEDAVKEIEAAIKKQGGDGSEKNPNAPSAKQSDKTNDSINSDLDTSNVDKRQKPPVSEKKLIKRKVQSLPGENTVKKAPVRSSRKTTIGIQANEEEEPAQVTTESDEPATKKTRKSISVEDKSNESETPHEDPSSISRAKSTPTDDKIEENGVAQHNGEDKDDKKTKHEIKSTRNKSEPKNSKNDSVMELENEPLPTLGIDTTEKVEEPQEKYEIISEKLLEYNILYAKHVSDHENLYKEKPVEPREDQERQVLPVELPSGILCGLKLHKDWPLKFPNEVERAIYDEKVAKSLLELKEQILSNKTNLEDHPDVVVRNIHFTSGELKEITQKRKIEETKIKAERLKAEANLVSLDGKIKNSLGLDNADPVRALDHLKQFEKVKIDAVMMKKHPHIMDTIRRLRKYVGNIKDWKLTESELEEFNKKASKIRAEAEKVYNRLKKTIKVPNNKPTFWEGFLQVVSEFRNQCSTLDLNEKQISLLCAEPSSRKAFIDRLQDSEISETPSN